MPERTRRCPRPQPASRVVTGAGAAPLAGSELVRPGVRHAVSRSGLVVKRRFARPCTQAAAGLPLAFDCESDIHMGVHLLLRSLGGEGHHNLRNSIVPRLSREAR